MRAGAVLMRVTSVAEVERLARDQRAVQHAEGRLQTDDAEGRLLERHVLLLGGVRRVVGGDAVEEAALERRDERRAVALGAQRRVHLEVGVERLDGLVGEREVVRRDLGGDPARPAALARAMAASEAARADVADVHGRVLVVGDVEGRGPRRGSRTSDGMPVRPSLRRHRPLVHLPALEERVVLGVHGRRSGR